MNFWQRTLITVLVFFSNSGLFPDLFPCFKCMDRLFSRDHLRLVEHVCQTVIGHFIFTDHSDDFRDLLSVHQRLYVGADLIFGRKFI